MIHLPAVRNVGKRASRAFGSVNLAILLTVAMLCSCIVLCTLDAGQAFAQDISDYSLQEESLAAFRKAATGTEPLTILVDTTEEARTASSESCYTPKVTWKCLNYLSMLAAGATTGAYVDEPMTVRMVDATSGRWEWTFSPLSAAITKAEPYFLDTACYPADSFEALDGFTSFGDYVGDDVMAAYPDAAASSIYLATEGWNDFRSSGCHASLRVKVTGYSDDIQTGDLVRIACYAAQVLPLHSAWYVSASRMPASQIVVHQGALNVSQIVVARVDGEGYVEFSPRVGGNYVISKVAEPPEASRTSLDTCTAATIDSQIWTGDTIEPSVMLENASGGRLVEGFDYTVTYSDNVDTGTATATLNGIGAYSGTRTENFTIAYPDPEPTNAITTSTYCISSAMSAYSDDDISIGGGQASTGTRVGVEKADDTIWQRFRIRRLDANGTYTIASAGSGGYLTAETSAKGNMVLQQDYAAGSKAQQWTIYDAGDGRYCFESVSSGLFLTVVEDASGSISLTVSGTTVTSTQQLFSLAKKGNTESSDTFTMTSALGGDALVGMSAGTEDEVGAACVAVVDDDTGQQSFSLEYADDGYYRIMSYLSGYYLNPADGSEGAAVIQSEKVDSALQKWCVVYDGMGRATFVNAQTGCTLAPQSEDAPSAGTAFVTHERDASQAERFTLRAVVPSAPDHTEHWYAGSSRYATAAIQALAAYGGGTDCVIIACGEDWKDALGAASLAGALDAPILLTPKTGISTDTLQAIKLLRAASSTSIEVIAVGGTPSVPAAALAQYALAGGGAQTERICGASFRATNQEIYRYGVEKGLWGDTVILATTLNFPDALSVSPVAFKLKAPVLLVDSGELDSTLMSEISGFGSALLLGGTNRISSAAESQVRKAVPTVTRLGGADRYGTSLLIARWGTSGGVLSWDGAALATGLYFPDALAAAALQGTRGSVLLLTEDDSAVTVEALIERKSEVTQVSYLGDTARFPISVQRDICSRLWNGAYLIDKVTTVG